MSKRSRESHRRKRQVNWEATYGACPSRPPSLFLTLSPLTATREGSFPLTRDVDARVTMATTAKMATTATMALADDGMET